jgi:hypothetical protein
MRAVIIARIGSAQSQGYGLDVVRIPVVATDFSLLQSVNDGSGIHPASYSVHTTGILFVYKHTGS